MGLGILCIYLNEFNQINFISGLTNDLRRRILEHYRDRGNPKHFSGRYSCYYLLYYEEFVYIDLAIKREKEIKKWSRKKKEDLIKAKNPEFRFLNADLFGEWPPKEGWVI